MDDAPMLRTTAGKPDTTARHVLQAMAEHASPKGLNCHPSAARIQYRTGYDRRTVQRAWRRLEEAGLIIKDGTIEDRTRWRLAVKRIRPAADWDEIKQAAEEDRAAVAERVRKHRKARSVTDTESVTVTHSGAVTESPVTHSASACNALEVRDVTHSASVRNALSAALTTNQPPVEPPTTGDGWGGSSTYPPQELAPNAPIDDDQFALTDAGRRWAASTYPNLDVDYETEQFIDHFRANAQRRHNWHAEWQKWIRRSAQYEAKKRISGQTVQLANGRILSGTDAKVAGWLALAANLDNQEPS